MLILAEILILNACKKLFIEFIIMKLKDWIYVASLLVKENVYRVNNLKFNNFFTEKNYNISSKKWLPSKLKVKTHIEKSNEQFLRFFHDCYKIKWSK